MLNGVVFENYKGYKFLDGDHPINGYEKCIGVGKDNWEVEDFALVHSTSHFPDGKILTNSDGKKTFSGKIEINGEYKKYEYVHPRKTVHFALNGKAGSHVFGNWDSCPFIVIEPMKNQIDNIVSVAPQDTYTFGSVNLSNEAVYLIQKEKFDSMDPSLLKGKNIIVFTGNPIVVTNEVLLSLGYNPQHVGKDNWIDIQEETIGLASDLKLDVKISLNKIKNEHQNIELFGQHYGSKYKVVEENLVEISQYLSAFTNKKVDLNNEFLLDYDLINQLYHFYISDYYVDSRYNKNKKDSINTFSDFVHYFNIGFINGNYLVRKIDDIYGDRNKMNEEQINTLYNRLKEYEQEKTSQEENNKIQEITNKLSNLTIEQAYEFAKEFPEYTEEIKDIINSMIRGKVQGYNSISIKNTDIHFLIGDDDFYDFVCQIPNIKIKNDGLAFLENIISKDTTLLEAQTIVNKYRNLYLDYLSHKEIGIKNM